MKIRYIIPNVVTFLALFCGLYSIKMAIQQDYLIACWFIIYAIMLDKLDGTIAKALKAQSKFGNYLDSISDAIAFGVAPGILIYLMLKEIVPSYHIVLFLSTVLFVFASVFRLVRYSLYESKFEDFYGIPTTLSASLLSPYIILNIKYDLPDIYLLALPFVLILLSVLMNSSFEFPKVRKRKSRAFNIFQTTVVIFVYILVLMNALPEVLFAIAFLYLVLGIAVGKR